jgi:hypothetical protein
MGARSTVSIEFQSLSLTSADSFSAASTARVNLSVMIDVPFALNGPRPIRGLKLETCSQSLASFRRSEQANNFCSRGAILRLECMIRKRSSWSFNRLPAPATPDFEIVTEKEKPPERRLLRSKYRFKLVWLSANHPFNALKEHPHPTHHRYCRGGEINRPCQLFTNSVHRALRHNSTSAIRSRRRRSSMYRCAILAEARFFAAFFCCFFDF